jgi:hypothetical protein
MDFFKLLLMASMLFLVACSDDGEESVGETVTNGASLSGAWVLTSKTVENSEGAGDVSNYIPEDVPQDISDYELSDEELLELSGEEYLEYLEYLELLEELDIPSNDVSDYNEYIYKPVVTTNYSLSDTTKHLATTILFFGDEGTLSIIERDDIYDGYDEGSTQYTTGDSYIHISPEFNSTRDYYDYSINGSTMTLTRTYIVNSEYSSSYSVTETLVYSKHSGELPPAVWESNIALDFERYYDNYYYND